MGRIIRCWLPPLSVVALLLFTFASPAAAMGNWVLWVNTIGENDIAPMSGHTTLTACERERDMWEGVQNGYLRAREESAVRDPKALQVPALVVAYRCLPDTVDPRERKGKRVGVHQVFSALATVHWDIAAKVVTAAATLGLVAVAFVQLRRFNRQVRADFTYKVYGDSRQWLRMNPDARAWIDEPDGKPLGSDHYDEWHIDEFLTYFEAVWSLWLKHLVDRDMVYDLLSDDLITVYEANNGEIEKIIGEMRSEPGDDDVFMGVEKLYQEMKQMTERKNPRKKSPPRALSAQC